MKHDISVLAYFGDDPSRTYQLSQWLPVLEILDERHPVAVVLRDQASADVLRARTSLPILVVPSFPELTGLYDALDAKVALYCNNSMLNFQSLLDARMLHVHVNHGESDKQSMASNNAKAYDRVLVAGPAAVERHAAGLLEFDLSRLVLVGRPQLDLRPAPQLAVSPRRTVLYAPTWEGDAEYNDYTSLDVMGREIVRGLLAVPDVRVVYKPHPKITSSRTPGVRAAHRDVTALVAAAAVAEPGAGHRSIPAGDILAIMPECDALVTDVSAVGPDWLYLRTDKPIFMTDRHRDPERLRQDSPLSRCADVIESGDAGGPGEVVARVTALVAARLENDEHHLARLAMRHHYFGELQVGDSTSRFLDAVTELVTLRDRLLGAAGAAEEITA